MKKFLIFLTLLLTGCPMAMDFSIGLGGNQRIKKTLDINQIQTDKQSDNQANIIEDIVNVFGATPTPTPHLPVVKSLTLEFVAPTPTPVFEGYIYKYKRSTPKSKLPCSKPTPVIKESYRLIPDAACVEGPNGTVYKADIFKDY